MNQAHLDSLPVVELTIEDITNGVTCISLVDEPAIEETWVAFSSHMKISLSTDKQILTAPLMIPDKKILRVGENGNEFTIRFTSKTVEDMRNKFFSDELIKKISFMHTDSKVDGFVVESWIINDSANDKARSLGFDLPKGTWMVSLQINDKGFWDTKVKTGEVRGFSLEGNFKNNPLPTNLSMETDKNIFQSLKDLFTSQSEKIDKTNQLLEAQLSSQQYLIETVNDTAGNILKSQVLQLSATHSVITDNYGKATLLHNQDQTFSSVPSGTYVSLSGQTFEVKNSMAYKFEIIPTDPAGVVAPATEPLTTPVSDTPEKETVEVVVVARLITIVDGEDMYLIEGGKVFRADLTPYPNGTYTTVETGETFEVMDGMIQIVSEPQMNEVQALKEQVKQLQAQLSKETFAKVVKVEPQTQLQNVKEQELSSTQRLSNLVSQKSNTPRTIQTIK